MVEHGLLDQVIGPLEDGLRDRQAECFRRLQVDDQLEGGGLLDRQIAGLCSLENLFHIARNTRGLKNTVWPIGQSTPTGDEFTPRSNHGQPLLAAILGDLGGENVGQP